MKIDVKICGIKKFSDAEAARDFGAAYIGFIFYKKSHRYVEPATVAEICRRVQGIKKVGVFVNESAYVVNDIAMFCGLDYVQLHGNESEEYARQLTCRIIKAFRWQKDFSAETANQYPADIVLLDTFNKDKVGGTGKTFDWQTAADESKKILKPLLIAGGISTQNAAEAIKIFKPEGLDVSGSLEENGEKSVKKMHDFMDYIKSINKNPFS